MVWQAVIFGPDDTPWEGGTFKLLLEFTEDYPNKVNAVWRCGVVVGWSMVGCVCMCEC